MKFEHIAFIILVVFLFSLFGLVLYRGEQNDLNYQACLQTYKEVAGKTNSTYFNCDRR